MTRGPACWRSPVSMSDGLVSSVIVIAMVPSPLVGVAVLPTKRSSPSLAGTVPRRASEMALCSDRSVKSQLGGDFQPIHLFDDPGERLIVVRAKEARAGRFR